jgi:hypothetical protein
MANNRMVTSYVTSFSRYSFWGNIFQYWETYYLIKNEKISPNLNPMEA